MLYPSGGPMRRRPRMPEVPVPDPEHTISVGDPGDETALRYRYQWTWAAIVCCELLDDTMDVQEVFCEHHEDVLLKHRDGSFTGHQVKTRGDNQDPWKARDEAVLDSCVRFAKLESNYPGRFRCFFFLTNHPLYCANNGQDLSFILKSIKAAASFEELSSTVAHWFQRVVRDSKVTNEVAFSALSKTRASSDLPKLRDAGMRVMDALAQFWAPAADCSHDAIRRAALSLIDECGRASSLDHQQLLPSYVSAIADTDTSARARIDGKRMTIDRIQNLLERGRDSTATLVGDPSFCVEPGEGSTDLLHRKLDAGGFSVVSRNSAEDLRDKAEYLGIVWTLKHGKVKGLGRYDHIRSLVLSDAGRAFDATRTEADKFGPAMREDLRKRFSDRRVAGDELFDTTIDHLEGIAFSLTAQCKVVWSHARPWESL